jgi:hypothetical protein
MMEIERLSVEERNQQYKPGSIKRVKLKNFLTYDAVEFFPGPVSSYFYIFILPLVHRGGIGAITSNF